LPTAAAADYLSVSRATIERLAHRGELPIVKVAGSTRYDVEDLDLYIAVNRCRNPQADGLRSVTLRDLIEREGEVGLTRFDGQIDYAA
jgi:excisionase family DNA binding protein